MICPSCSNEDTKVIDSRPLNDGSIIKRRRKCEKCQFRFTTHEKIQVQLPMIIKKDGRRENYDRDKILSGLKKATQKGPISTEQLEEIINEIEKEFEDVHLKEVPAENIGQKVITKLLDLDPVAFVRFASFYWDFHNIETFVKELQKRPLSWENKISN